MIVGHVINRLVRGVVGGMVAGTFLGIFFVPLFFVVVQRFVDRMNRSRGRTSISPVVEPHKEAPGHE